MGVYSCFCLAGLVSLWKSARQISTALFIHFRGRLKIVQPNNSVNITDKAMQFTSNIKATTQFQYIKLQNNPPSSVRITLNSLNITTLSLKFKGTHLLTVYHCEIEHICHQLFISITFKYPMALTVCLHLLVQCYCVCVHKLCFSSQ